MAMTKVQEKDGVVNSSTSQTVTYDSPTTSNNLLTLQTFCRGNNLTNPSGWTTAINVDNTTESDELRISYKISDGTETDVTITWSGSDNSAMHILEWSGNETSGVLDVTTSTGRTTGATSLSTGTSAATAQNDELLIAAAGIRGDTTGESWTNSVNLMVALQAGSANYASMHDGEKNLTTTGTQETTAQWTNSQTAMACLATFKETGAGGGLGIPIAAYHYNHHLGTMTG